MGTGPGRYLFGDGKSQIIASDEKPGTSIWLSPVGSDLVALID